MTQAWPVNLDRATRAPGERPALWEVGAWLQGGLPPSSRLLVTRSSSGLMKEQHTWHTLELVGPPLSGLQTQGCQSLSDTCWARQPLPWAQSPGLNEQHPCTIFQAVCF